MSSARNSGRSAAPVSSCETAICTTRRSTHIGRFKLTPGELKPAGPAEIVVDGFPVGGGHAEKDIAFDDAGNVYVNIGLPSNACQIPDRRPGAPGIDPCPQLDDRGGIWRFKADVVGQKFTKEARFATGMRQPVAVAWHDGHLYVAMNSRDSLDTLFPEKGYTAEDNAFGPSEPMLQVAQGDVFGWPYCYHDTRLNKMILAPEYGGDGKTVGRCSQFKDIFAEFPGALRAGRFDVLHAHALSREVSRRRVHDVARLVESRAVSDGGLQHPVSSRSRRVRTPARTKCSPTASKAWNP